VNQNLKFLTRVYMCSVTQAPYHEKVPGIILSQLRIQDSGPVRCLRKKIITIYTMN